MSGKAKWLVLAVAVAAGGGGWWYFANDAATRALAWRTAKIEQGTIQSTVSASGSLKAVVTVEVGTQVSGQVSALHADYNTQVKKGQVIARIDPRTFEAKVKESEADLEISRGQLAAHVAAVRGMAADIVAARAAVVEAKLDLERKAKLLPGRTISKAVYDKAKSVYDQAEAKLVSAKAKVQQQRAQIQVARAQVRRNQALLTQRKIDLERTFIRSPVDGVVINRNVDVGQTVAASLQAPILFTIAKDLRQMQVEVSVDEADIGRIAVGQQSNFTVDSFQGRTFRGRVQQVPQGVEGRIQRHHLYRDRRNPECRSASAARHDRECDLRHQPAREYPQGSPTAPCGSVRQVLPPRRHRPVAGGRRVFAPGSTGWPVR